MVAITQSITGKWCGCGAKLPIEADATACKRCNGFRDEKLRDQVADRAGAVYAMLIAQGKISDPEGWQ